MAIQEPIKQRNFVPADFKVTDWEGLKQYFDILLQEQPESLEELEAYLRKVSELEAVIAEDMAWRYIHMTRDTQSETYTEHYQFFIREILPHLSIYQHQLNQKIASNPYFDQLPDYPYQTFKRSLKRDIELFREENVKLKSEEQSITQEYSVIMGEMTIEHKGKTITLQQAGKYLEKQDRALRKEVWEKVAQRRLQDVDRLDEVLDKLLKIRHQIAVNAGYESYTQYKFASMKRFDYSPEDTLNFHHAVETVVKPIFQAFMDERKARLGYDELKPWDTAVDIYGTSPLEPFEDGQELVNKSQNILKRIKPELGEMLQIMKNKGYLDVDSRLGKAPGGYNYPLMETGVPFIFMNAAGTQNDVITLLHESGHAIHSFVTQGIPLNDLKSTPSEVAELASMSMELISLDYYDEFYQDEQELTRAKKDQLRRSITIFPWIATVDAFQQWMYDHHDHSREERRNKWVELYHRFHGESIDWSEYEHVRANLWQRQLHIYEVPFYYIEYAIAQLGALAVWHNYKKSADAGLQQYLDALKLGYTRTIPEVYDTAGIKFDFSADYMRKQVEFCLQEYHKLELA